jgi:hypothetical protein
MLCHTLAMLTHVIRNHILVISSIGKCTHVLKAEELATRRNSIRPPRSKLSAPCARGVGSRSATISESMEPKSTRTSAPTGSLTSTADSGPRLYPTVNIPFVGLLWQQTKLAVSLHRRARLSKCTHEWRLMAAKQSFCSATRNVAKGSDLTRSPSRRRMAGICGYR